MLGASVGVALVLYVGSYAALCKPVGSGVLVPPLHPGATVNADELYVPTYRVGGSFSANLFRPLAKLDMRLFPGRWSRPGHVMVYDSSEAPASASTPAP